MQSRLRRTRVRLTLLFVVGFTVVAGVAATAFCLMFSSLEYQAVDTALTSQEPVVASQMDEIPGGVSFGDPDDTSQQLDRGIAAVAVAPDGRVLGTSGKLSTLPDYVAAARHGTSGRPRTVLIDGQPERVLVQPFQLDHGTSGRLLIARSVVDVEHAVRHVQVLFALVVAGLVIGTAILGYWLTGRALHSVRIMSALARDITEHDLHRRISLALPPGDELGELAETFNGMLERLQAAFDALQRFTADAAHELRAPLTLMRTQVDVTLRRERTDEAYRSSHETLRAEIERLSRVADQLLLLARSDSGALAVQLRDVDLAQLVEDTVERWRDVARDKEIGLDGHLPLDGSVYADPELIIRLLDNLVDNAIRHTPPGGRVTVAAAAAGEEARIDVSDTGPGIDPGFRPRLFERFARADAARGRDSGGAGLGLSLCAAIAHLHGGTITLEPDEPGAHFTVRIPDRRTVPRVRAAS
jgi:heavy metal sensor kinase